MGKRKKSTGRKRIRKRVWRSDFKKQVNDEIRTLSEKDRRSKEYDKVQRNLFLDAYFRSKK